MCIFAENSDSSFPLAIYTFYLCVKIFVLQVVFKARAKYEPSRYK